MLVSVPAHAEFFLPDKSQYEAVTVNWFPVDDVTMTCNHLSGLRDPKWKYNDKIIACTLLDTSKQVCDIYTSKHVVAYATFGHELRHCFDPTWHD